VILQNLYPKDSEKMSRLRKVFQSIGMILRLPRQPRLILATRYQKSQDFHPGNFVGMMADDPDQKIKLKNFNCEILNDHEVLKKEQHPNMQLPVISTVD
jgi:hypothetical protein